MPTTAIERRVALDLIVEPARTIWCRKEGKVPTFSDNFEAFTESQAFDLADTFRIYGSSENAEFIVKLRDHIVQNDIPKTILLGTPMGVPSSWAGGNLRTQVESRFAGFCQLNGVPTSCGGWHAMTVTDEIVYSFVYNPPETDEAAQIQLERLPMWPALSFLRRYYASDMVELLAEIRDPRWYIDPKHPDRSSKLRNYLGLHMSSILAALRNETENRQQCRVRKVLNAWHRVGPGSDHCKWVPGAFLYRVAYGSIETVTPAGLLRASELFIDFLRHVWLDSAYGGRYELFLPEYFFADEDVVAAYREHVA